MKRWADGELPTEIELRFEVIQFTFSLGVQVVVGEQRKYFYERISISYLP